MFDNDEKCGLNEIRDLAQQFLPFAKEDFLHDGRSWVEI